MTKTSFFEVFYLTFYCYWFIIEIEGNTKIREEINHMSIEELLMLLNPEDEIRYQSIQFQKSEEIIKIEMDNYLSTEKAADFLKITNEKMMNLELGSLLYSEEEYNKIILQLKKYPKSDEKSMK